MKKAVILHGTDGTPQDNWFPWLQEQLVKLGYKVWVPELPQADKPNIQRYNEYISRHIPWPIDKDTILIGHSSGAVAILGLLQSLTKETVVKACYLVGAFKDDLGWDSLKELFLEPFEFEKIKPKFGLMYFLHSDNDPHCPLEHAQYLHSQIGGDLIVLPGQKHFSVGSFGEEYRQFPYLLRLIEANTMKAPDVVTLYQTLENQGIKIWIDGGWGVDALLEKQTRPHADLDMVIEKKDVETLNSFLANKGYTEIFRGDSMPQNYMYGDKQTHLVDVHVIELDKNGNGIYGPVEDGKMYPAAAVTGKGWIKGAEVRCISPEWVVKFHTGYKLRDVDYHDVLAVCEKFGIEVPEEYQD
jgi:lincosamide nucleotidyltransferase A/C/D/E